MAQHRVLERIAALQPHSIAILFRLDEFSDDGVTAA